MTDFDKARKKKARERRQRQKATRNRTWTGLSVKDWGVLKQLIEREKKWQKFNKEVGAYRWKHHETPMFVAKRPGERKGTSFKNPGKTAVRNDRRIRKATQRKAKKARARR